MVLTVRRSRSASKLSTWWLTPDNRDFSRTPLGRLLRGAAVNRTVIATTRSALHFRCCAVAPARSPRWSVSHNRTRGMGANAFPRPRCDARRDPSVDADQSSSRRGEKNVPGKVHDIPAPGGNHGWESVSPIAGNAISSYSPTRDDRSIFRRR